MRHVHHTAVVTVTRDDAQRHVANCACGWRGPWQAGPDTAGDDAADHAAATR